jgi:hypothetical protein
MPKNLFAWMTIWFATFNIVLCSAAPTKAMTAEEAIAAIRAFNEYMIKIRQISNPQPQLTAPKVEQPSSETSIDPSTSKTEPVKQGD